MSLDARFRRHFASLEIGPARLLVAVSGGPDSVALLDLLAAARADLGLELVVAHIDHGIDPESGAVADGVRALAGELGLPYAARALGLGARATETRAREARYAALEQLRAEVGAEWIVTAHHADDQAETVLMRVLGGSGPAGLAGMAPRQGRVLRPLLPFRRAELAQHVRRYGSRLWDDPANRDTRQLRSWIRHELLPSIEGRIPDVRERLLRVADASALDRQGWDRILDSWPELDVRVEQGGVSVAVKALEVLDSKLSLALIMALGRRCGFQLGPKRALRVWEVVRGGESGSWVPLAGEWRAERSYDRLRIVVGAVEPSEPWVLSGDRGEGVWGGWRIRWIRTSAPASQERAARSAWFVPGELAVRPWRAGERMKPLGGVGRRLVVRCFQDARVPRSLRSGWPALEQEGSIVWIPGVCRSDRSVPIPGAEALRVDAEHA
ncbi:MAG TPA: tRNA lysidine(34) synthetase TilS [Gemmatimonadales bacterium]|nr:tRNA lysidine(34) synthetase TilS [Gemmatimonadales bacterium]